MNHKPGTLLMLKNEHKNTDVGHLGILMNHIAEIIKCDNTKHGDLCLLDVHFHGVNKYQSGLYFHRFDVLWEPPESEDKS